MADKKPTKWDYDKIPSWGRRFAPLDDSNMSPEQKKALSTMLKGPRVKILGPSSGWLRSPEMMTRAQHFGDFVRGSEVSAKLKEMTILITGRFWDAEFEWYAHEILARAAGLNEEIIQSIKQNKRPTTMDATETALYDFLTELLHTRRVSDAAFNNLKTKLGGDKPLIELVGLSAYYTFVSFTLNIDEMAIPPDAEPLPKIPRSKM